MADGLSRLRLGLSVPALIAASVDPGFAAAQQRTDDVVPAIQESTPLSPEELERMRSKLFFFAEMISMRSQFSPLGSSHPSTVGDVLERFAKSQEDEKTTFSDYPTLQTAYRDVRSFLVNSKGSITPALRELVVPVITPDPFEYPELALITLFAQMSLELAKHNAVQNWCLKYDAKCRSAYQQIMPMMRKVALGERAVDPVIDIKSSFTKQNWVYLDAINVSGVELTNVSLGLELKTIDSESAKHFFFIPVWRASADMGDADADEGIHGANYFIRIATDWLEIGAQSTTSVTAEIVSDQFLAQNLRFNIDAHIPTAADRVLDQAARQLASKHRPRLVIDRVERIRGSIGAYSDRVSRAEELIRIARVNLNTQIDRIETEIRKLGEEIEQLRRDRSDSPKGEKRERRKSRQDKIDKKLAGLLEKQQQLRREKDEWQSGQR